MRLQATLAATMAFGGTLLVLGVIAGYINIYWLGHDDYKFGPDGSFQVFVLIHIVLTAVLTIGIAIAAALCSGWLVLCPRKRVVLFFAAMALPALLWECCL